ncbi:putative Zinc-finger of C2H2 type-containing protein [Homarus americanus]|uniref:Putative Zinc-finger of C2H2 type-containing protein n=1 Tax=Homarus americanus TaxID=6706 RepID=A0A8J5JWC0_HOMAM|nr:putative Zinc-finger of C2H2 type-containing protein [Homarus americanus]
MLEALVVEAYGVVVAVVSTNMVVGVLQTLLAQGVSPRRVARLVCGSDTVCPLCRKTFSYPESMIRHCQGHLPTAHRLRCSACGKTFHRRDQFKYHQARCEARHAHLHPGPLLPPPSL